MSDVQHREAAAGRWGLFTVAEQLGHVGSEVSRALKWRARNADLSRNAFFRALELIDLMLDDPRHRAAVTRLREIARTREVLVDFLDGPNQYNSTPEALQQYFDAYAVAARRRSVPPSDRLA